MNMHQGHPQHVVIPDARTAGVRAYREPAEPHPLQLAFLEEAGERQWVEQLHRLLAAGDATGAEARLREGLAPFEGALATLCKRMTAQDVVIDGWEDLLPILSEWEGPPVTAITLGLTNAPDLVFEGGQAQEPELLLGLYSDEAYPFSTVDADALLDECSRDLPAWVGKEEDVEFYCAAGGLGELNAALIGHKHRHFLRDGRDGVEGRAPGGYVEYVLGCWLRSTLFLQAVQRASKQLPAGCRLVAGAVSMNADFVTLIEQRKPRTATRKKAAKPAEPQFATLTIKPWVPREEEVAVTGPASGASLRQRVLQGEAEAVRPTPAEAVQAAPPPVPAPAPAPARKPGWLARLFRFGRRP
jgi:hypothetical protein